MELRHLRYFLAVAEELHFGRAAQRLQMSQPPLSQQIQALEQELGVQLFERSQRRIQMTVAGQTFLEETRQILQQVDKAILATQRASRGEIGHLSIGFVSTVAYGVLPKVLRIFREQFPEVQVDLREMHLPSQLQNLQNRELDLGFVPLPIYESNLETLGVQKEAILVALPDFHPLAEYAELPLESLATEPFVLFPRALAMEYHNQLLSLCQEAGFEPRVVQEANSMGAIINLVAAGMGVSLLPNSVQNLQRQGVVYRRISGSSSTVTLGAVWSKQNTSSVLQVFLQVLRQSIEL